MNIRFCGILSKFTLPLSSTVALKTSSLTATWTGSIVGLEYLRISFRMSCPQGMSLFNRVSQLPCKHSFAGCYYLIGLRVHSVGKALYPGHLLKYNQYNCLTLPLLEAAIPVGKQEPEQTHHILGNKISIGGF